MNLLTKKINKWADQNGAKLRILELIIAAFSTNSSCYNARNLS